MSIMPEQAETKYFKVTINEMGVGAWIYRGHFYDKGEYHQVLTDALNNSKPLYPRSTIGVDAIEVSQEEYDEHAFDPDDLPF